MSCPYIIYISEMIGIISFVYIIYIYILHILWYFHMCIRQHTWKWAIWTMQSILIHVSISENMGRAPHILVNIPENRSSFCQLVCLWIKAWIQKFPVYIFHASNIQKSQRKCIRQHIHIHISIYIYIIYRYIYRERERERERYFYFFNVLSGTSSQPSLSSSYDFDAAWIQYTLNT